MKIAKGPVAPEFSRMVDVIRLGHIHKIKANEAECAAIAQRLGLPAIELLEAELELKRGRGDRLHVKGRFHARLSQTCVVSLEDFPAELTAEIEDSYSEAAQPLHETLNLVDEEPDAPEPIINGKIDLGELVVQNLSLELDPFPRKPGAEFKGYDK